MSREMLVSASCYCINLPPVLFVYKSLISPIQTDCGLPIYIYQDILLSRPMIKFTISLVQNIAL